MKQKPFSLYQDSPVLKRGQKLTTGLANIAVCLVLSILFFLATDAIGSSAGLFKDDQQVIAAKEKALLDVIEDTNLATKRADGTLLGTAEEANNYVLSLTLGSLLEAGHDADSLSKTIYQSIDPITPESDKAFSYYCSFKEGHVSEFDEERRENKGVTYYLQKLSNGLDGYFADGDYPYLTNETAEQIDESYRNGSFTEGINKRETLKNRYRELLSEAIDEVKTSYVPYKEAYQLYESAYRNAQSKKIGEAFIGYGIAMILYYLIAPLLLKHGQTVVDLLLKRPYVSTDKREIGFLNVGIRFLVVLAESVGLPCLGMLIIYGARGVDVLSLSLFGVIPLLSIMIFSFVLLLVSYIFSFFKIDRKQTLSELCSMMVQVDRRRSRE